MDTWTTILTHKCRDCHDGAWCTIRIDKWSFGKTQQLRPPYRVTVEWDWYVAGQELTVIEDNVSLQQAKKTVDRLIQVYSGRRYQGRWVVCEATLVPKGWESIPWPGFCERGFR